MIAVTLSDATQTSRLLARAVAEAVNDLSQRSHSPPWSARLPLVIRATAETLKRVFSSAEINGRDVMVGDRLMGLDVQIDNTVRPNVLKIVDPRTQNSETIEVR